MDRRVGQRVLYGLRPTAGPPSDRTDGGGDCSIQGIGYVESAHAAGRLEVIESFESFAVLGVDGVAEAVAVALVAHQGDRDYCVMTRGKLAEELGLTAPRVTFGLTELERAGWLTISRRQGYPSSFAIAPVVQSLLAKQAETHRAAFGVGTRRMTAPEAIALARKSACRLYLDERGELYATGPRDALRGVIAELEAAEIVDSVTAWLQERDLGESYAVRAAQRLLAK